ncbi:MAG: efflux RND transporter periplasmic adaptor subunit [Chitinophagales bacterium]|nr:efflux RND transporter periplasmic adaptor subunit [Chitinophagales bacterium]
MDRVIPKKRWTTKRILTYAGIAGMALLIIASYYFTTGKSRLNVDTERITISEVKNGSFQEFIPVNGVVLPITTIYLDATEGGRVEEKYVEDGAVLKKNDPILKLVNTDLELDLANRQTAVFDVLTQMQNTKNLSDQNTIRELNQMADVENAFEEAQRIFFVDSTLYKQGAIGLQEFQSAKNNYDYQISRRKLAGRTLASDSISTKQQLRQMHESYAHMQNALSLMQRKVGDLIVRAPVDGQLTSLDAEIGESKNNGDRLGQIDVLSGYKVRVDVDEHYISRIFTGLMGDFTFANKTYQLKIKKIFTQVNNGRFQVDMEFVNEVPQGIRRGQTLQIRLALSDETQALLLPKGGFFQQTGGNWIFKVNASGATAYKTDIQIGRQNPDYYEVLQGLKPGDKVVTSSYENYGTMDELVLKK